MNYAKATKGKSTQADFLREIDCQSEVDLDRSLDPEEKALLFSRFPPGLVASRVNKVHIFKALFFFSLFLF